MINVHEHDVSFLTRSTKTFSIFKVFKGDNVHPPSHASPQSALAHEL